VFEDIMVYDNAVSVSDQTMPDLGVIVDCN